MKKLLSVLLLLLVALPALSDSAEYWTSADDPYYHSDPSCPGGRVYPISPEAAEEFDKSPCPNCIGETASGGVAYPGVYTAETGNAWDPSFDRDMIAVEERLYWISSAYDEEGFTHSAIVSAPIDDLSNPTTLYVEPQFYINGIARADAIDGNWDGSLFLMTHTADSNAERKSRLLRLDADGNAEELLALDSIASNLFRVGNDLFFVGNNRVCRYDILSGEVTNLFQSDKEASIDCLQYHRGSILFTYTDVSGWYGGSADSATPAQYRDGLYSVPASGGEANCILPGYVYRFAILNDRVYAAVRYEEKESTCAVDPDGGNPEQLSEQVLAPDRAYSPYLLATTYDVWASDMYLFDCTDGFDPDTTPYYLVPASMRILGGYAVWVAETLDDGTQNLASMPIEQYVSSLTPED